MRQLLFLALLSLPAYGQMLAFGSGPHIAHVGGGGACTPASGYAHCRVLTADHTQMGGSTLLGFPVLVSTTLGAGRILNASCFDVVFTSDSGGTSLIPWEKESCTQSTGAIVHWALCASCSSTVDTLLYMSYGNAGATVAQNTGLNGPTYVWDGNYKGVWHVAGSGSMGDSTANGNTFTNTAATSATGQIDGAVAFAYGQSLRRAALVSSPNVTVSAWLYCTNLGSGDLVLNEQPDANYALDNWQLGLAPGGPGSAPRFLMFSGASVYSVSASANAAINTWYHLAASYDGATLRIYVNGVVTSVYAGVVMNSNTLVLEIGRLDQSGSYGFIGTADEIRISNTARPSGQITAEVNSQKTGSTFLTYGVEL